MKFTRGVDEVEDSRRTRTFTKFTAMVWLMQNGQKFGSVLWRMLEWKSMSMKELHTQPITKVSP